MLHGVLIDDMQPQDWPDVRTIYREGIATGMATFETEAPSWDAWDESHLKFGRIVARKNDETIGWAALSPISHRQAYAGVAEVSVYVASLHRGAGVGRALLGGLVLRSEHANIWTLQAVVFPDNAATIALHTSCGFREVGWRERVGKLNGLWRDTILFERRSKSVGVD